MVKYLYVYRTTKKIVKLFGAFHFIFTTSEEVNFNNPEENLYWESIYCSIIVECNVKSNLFLKRSAYLHLFIEANFYFSHFYQYLDGINLLSLVIKFYFFFNTEFALLTFKFLTKNSR